MLSSKTLEESVVSRIGHVTKLIGEVFDERRVPGAIDRLPIQHQRKLQPKDIDSVPVAEAGRASHEDAWQSVGGTAHFLKAEALGAAALDADGFYAQGVDANSM
jgi:hypothetical protein